ncbi:glycosyltransferase family 2 protein [Nocardioides montaniterrae]
MTAVVLIGFNRPAHTARTLDAIRAVRPEQLFLLADGPRADRPDDVRLCAETRAAMDAVDWPCDVRRRYSDANLGCEGNVETGLDWVFGQTDAAIILEDDCVADPTFFAYAAELLERYRDDPRVWQVAGNGHGVPSAYFGGDSYRFSAWASVWGWATWADRWQRHRTAFPRDHRGPGGDAPLRAIPAAPRPELLVTRAGRAHFAEAATSADIVRHGWDKQWWLTMMTEGGLAATPAVNMVQNVGFGAGATHGVFERETEAALPMPMPLRHPAAVALDVEVERDLELLLSRVGGRSVELARRMVTNPRLRAVGRKVLHSKAMASTTRIASRLTDRGATRD